MLFFIELICELIVPMGVLCVRIHSISYVNTHTITHNQRKSRHMKLVTQFGITITYVWEAKPGDKNLLKEGNKY